MKTELGEPDSGMLTSQMDFDTKGFDEFQAILLKKSKERSIEKKRNIELLALKYDMEDYVRSEGKHVKSVGDFLKSILKSLQVRQNRFAEYIGLKPSNLAKLMNGERSINYDLAIIFGHLFNHDPMLWIEIQAKNELYKLLVAKRNKYDNYTLNDLVKK